MPVVVGTRVESGMWKIYLGSAFVFDELSGSVPTEVDLGLVRLRKIAGGGYGCGCSDIFYFDLEVNGRT